MLCLGDILISVYSGFIESNNSDSNVTIFHKSLFAFTYTYITIGNSLSCNSPLTKPCLGEKDSRYNPNASNSLIEQNPIWEKYTGYWGPTQTNAQLSDGPPRQPALYNITSGEGWLYKSDVFKGFRLTKVDGSRYTVQGIYIYELAPDSFVTKGMCTCVISHLLCEFHY